VDKRKNKDMQKEWLNVNRICKEVRWLMYDPDYGDFDIAAALEVLEQLKSRVGEQINEDR
jgi:hypothetical protein